MTNRTRDDADRSWKNVAADWLVSQGVSTVLLFSILAAIIYGVPFAWNKFDIMHERVEKRGAEAVGKASEQRKIDFEQVTKAIDKQSISIDKATEGVNKLVSEIRSERIERRGHP